MRLLQTGDLHLGKMFYDYSLYEDQKYILDCIIDELQTAKKNYEPYDALLICGDIYDRAIPPPDAVALFDDFLTTVHNFFPNTEICIISGNHDSAKRLSFASKLIENQGIHICTSADSICKPVLLTTELLDGSTERLAIYQLPYLIPGMLDTKEHTFRTQQDLVKEAIRRISSSHVKKYPGIPAVLTAHLFTKGCQSSDSERLFIGNEEQISADIFSNFSYTAVGHLHTCQQQGERLWYAGSPLAYSFSETKDKYLLSVHINLSRIDISHDMPLAPIEVQKIRLFPLHRTVRLQGTFDSFLNGSDFDTYMNDYIEICCTDNFIIENPMALLKTKFPRLLSFKQEIAPITKIGLAANRSISFDQNNGQPTQELFNNFLIDVYTGTKLLKERNTEIECQLFMDIVKSVYTISEEIQ